MIAGAEHFKSWCCFNPGFQCGATCNFHAVGLRALLWGFWVVVWVFFPNNIG